MFCRMTTYRTRAWLLFVGIVVSQLAAAYAQDPPSKEQAALVDGLLDLLSDPAPARTLDSPSAPNQVPIPAQSDSEQDLSLDPSLADHPLLIIRKNMRAAATHLNQGAVGNETRQLQVDIVQRLDSLIEEMRQADSSRASQPQPQPQQQHSPEPQASESSSSSQEQSTSSDAGETSDQHGDGQPTGSQSAQNRPSQAGPTAGVTVDLADPERLQQDVWGQLPEQVRQQMQSRMVERFLPSYRPQIEAYFRALLQSEKR